MVEYNTLGLLKERFVFSLEKSTDKLYKLLIYGGLPTGTSSLFCCTAEDLVNCLYCSKEL